MTLKNGRYVVPVKAEYKNEIKGLVHDTSASGSTIFIEPSAVVEANNEIRILETKEQREIEKVLYEMSVQVASCALRMNAISSWDLIRRMATISPKISSMTTAGYRCCNFAAN